MGDTTLLNNGIVVCGWWFSRSEMNDIHSPQEINLVFDGIDSIKDTSCVVLHSGGFGFTVLSLGTTSQVLLGTGQSKDFESDMHNHDIRNVAIGFDTIVTSSDFCDIEPSDTNHGASILHVFRFSDKAMCNVPPPIRSNLRVTGIAAGMRHVLLLEENGHVYQYGDGVKCGFHVMSAKDGEPVLLHDIQGPVKAIACGPDHSVALNEQGKVFTWGSNLRGECGRGYSGHGSLTPGLVERLETLQVVSIACGLSFTLCCTSLGDVYSWGTSQDGALGHGQDTTLYFPSLIEYFGDRDDTMAVQVSAGSSHSLVRTSMGSVYAFGCNKFGQLGLGAHVPHTTLPTRVAFETENNICVDVRGGWWHTVFNMKHT